jgi:hypothetical protein
VNHNHHLSINGKRAEGRFIPKHVYDSQWTNLIRTQFIAYYTSLVTDDGAVNSPTTKPAPCKVKTIRVNVLQKYSEQWKRIMSNTTCLACLQEAPENVLRCGHAYCVRCVRELGKESTTFESAWEFNLCPLCCAPTQENYSHLVRVKPRCAGGRVLTLDGGGIRGIIELAVVNELDKNLALGIPFRDFFDLIIGTSTGERFY